MLSSPLSSQQSQLQMKDIQKGKTYKRCRQRADKQARDISAPALADALTAVLSRKQEAINRKDIDLYPAGSLCRRRFNSIPFIHANISAMLVISRQQLKCRLIESKTVYTFIRYICLYSTTTGQGHEGSVAVATGASCMLALNRELFGE